MRQIFIQALLLLVISVILAANNPNVTREKQMYPDRVTVSVGFTSELVLKPYFFDGTVTGQAYLLMLKEHVIPQLRKRKILRKCTFQQDGAPAHINGSVRDLLQKTFTSNVISRNFEKQWPPRFPDLSSIDYYLLGMFIFMIWSDEIITIRNLKEKISALFSEMPTEELKKTRLQMVIASNGIHFEHLRK